MTNVSVALGIRRLLLACIGLFNCGNEHINLTKGFIAHRLLYLLTVLIVSSLSQTFGKMMKTMTMMVMTMTPNVSRDIFLISRIII